MWVIERAARPSEVGNWLVEGHVETSSRGRDVLEGSGSRSGHSETWDPANGFRDFFRAREGLAQLGSGRKRGAFDQPGTWPRRGPHPFRGQGRAAHLKRPRLAGRGEHDRTRLTTRWKTRPGIRSTRRAQRGCARRAGRGRPECSPPRVFTGVVDASFDPSAFSWEIAADLGGGADPADRSARAARRERLPRRGGGGGGGGWRGRATGRA